MIDATGYDDEFAPSGRLRIARRKHPVRIVPALVALAGSGLVGALILNGDPALGPDVTRPVLSAATADAKPIAITLDPAIAMAFSGTLLGRTVPLAADLVLADAGLPPPAAEPAVVVASAETMLSAPAATPSPPVEVALPQVVPVSPLVATIPVPVPRPSELDRNFMPAPLRSEARTATRVARAAQAAPIAPADNRSMFEKLFGLSKPPAGAQLAYASPEDSVVSRLFSAARPSAPDRQTAVYDISAHTVVLPNGTQLEAHSGLGTLLDDPRYVSARNRGATPPHLYELQLRGQSFHGVQALRLTPVGNGGVFGRVGLLAHTFMLGPNGDSNGCVSFRNYNAFLQAYMSGEVKRLQVVERRI